MVNQQLTRLLNRPHFNYGSLFRNPDSHHLITIRSTAMPLTDEAPPGKLDFLLCQPVLQRMIVHYDFGHTYPYFR